MAGNSGGSASLFEVPLSLNQTPVSGITDYGAVTTGSFFSAPQASTPPSGSDLIGGTSFNTSGGNGLLIGAGVILLLALALKGK